MAHAALAAVALVVIALAPPHRHEEPVVFEVVHKPPAPAPPLLSPPNVNARASVNDSVASARRSPAPRVRAPLAPGAPAMAIPAPDRTDAEPTGLPAAASLGSAAGVSFAPPAPPPPPREVRTAEADATFVDNGFVHLETLVISWQHNDGVRDCIERQMGSSEHLAQLSQNAHGRLLEAVKRGDHDAALAEARRLHDAASSFDALYRRARHCLE